MHRQLFVSVVAKLFGLLALAAMAGCSNAPLRVWHGADIASISPASADGMFIVESSGHRKGLARQTDLVSPPVFTSLTPISSKEPRYLAVLDRKVGVLLPGDEFSEIPALTKAGLAGGDLYFQSGVVGCRIGGALVTLDGALLRPGDLKVPSILSPLRGYWLLAEYRTGGTRHQVMDAEGKSLLTHESGSDGSNAIQFIQPLESAELLVGKRNHGDWLIENLFGERLSDESFEDLPWRQGSAGQYHAIQLPSDGSHGVLLKPKGKPLTYFVLMNGKLEATGEPDLLARLHQKHATYWEDPITKKAYAGDKKTEVVCDIKKYVAQETGPSSERYLVAEAKGFCSYKDRGALSNERVNLGMSYMEPSGAGIVCHYLERAIECLAHDSKGNITAKAAFNEEVRPIRQLADGRFLLKDIRNEWYVMGRPEKVIP